MPTWLVTGGSGFLGRHLLATLADSLPLTDRVVALGRRLPAGWPIDAFRRVDLLDTPALTAALDAVRPAFLLHAAGATPPTTSAATLPDQHGSDAPDPRSGPVARPADAAGPRRLGR